MGKGEGRLLTWTVDRVERVWLLVIVLEKESPHKYGVYGGAARRPIRRNVLPTRERKGKKEGGLCKMFWRNGLQLLNPETKESERKERTRLPPSSPRSISHDSQTLENLIELSTRNIAVVEGGVGAIHTDFQSDMPVDYIWSWRERGAESPSREGREEKFDCGRTPSNNPFSLCLCARNPHLFPPCPPLSLLRNLSHMENTMMEVRPPRDAEQRRQPADAPWTDQERQGGDDCKVSA